MGTAFVFSIYDPAHPETVVFPWLISTWFVAGVLTLVGLAGTIIGAVLWYWANKPVELPEIAHSAPGKLQTNNQCHPTRAEKSDPIQH